MGSVAHLKIVFGSVIKYSVALRKITGSTEAGYSDFFFLNSLHLHHYNCAPAGCITDLMLYFNFRLVFPPGLSYSTIPDQQTSSEV